MLHCGVPLHRRATLCPVNTRYLDESWARAFSDARFPEPIDGAGCAHRKLPVGAGRVAVWADAPLAPLVFELARCGCSVPASCQAERAGEGPATLWLESLKGLEYLRRILSDHAPAGTGDLDMLISLHSHFLVVEVPVGSLEDWTQRARAAADRGWIGLGRSGDPEYVPVIITPPQMCEDDGPSAEWEQIRLTSSRPTSAELSERAWLRQDRWVRGSWLSTSGLDDRDHPELEMVNVPAPMISSAYELLQHCARYVIEENAALNDGELMRLADVGGLTSVVAFRRMPGLGAAEVVRLVCVA